MSRRTAFKIALPAVVALGAGTAVAIAAIPSSSDGVIHACYVTTGSPSGQLRVVDADANPPQTCTTGEQTLTWNQQGPTGPPGPPGDQGPPGDSGGDNSGGTGSGPLIDNSQPGGPTADIFLSLDGIPGDSTDAKHRNQISIESFAFLAKKPTSARNGSATRLSSLRLDKVYDVSSPRLFAAATSGHHIKSATLTFSTDGGTGNDVVTYRLSDVTVTSYEQGGANPDAKALGSLEEEVGLHAAKIAVSEKTQTASGKSGPSVSASWDVPRTRR